MRLWIFVLVLFFIGASYAEDSKPAEKDKPTPKESHGHQKNNIYSDLVPDELYDFRADLPWEQQDYLDEINKAIAQAIKKGTPMSSDRINDLLKEKSKDLYEKKMEVLHTVNKKVDAMTSKAKDFIEKLCVTSLISGHHWGVGTNEKMFALLRKEVPMLSEEDQKSVVEQFPKYKKIFDRRKQS
ncbi:hypothetical protein L596_015746 [Steinernema carpocapsae]|uniref:SXP/RAL-2 family protein Ani s 5-like cation-binding domain-containing protein n=1 Tax=Steinernema carpocapsae TaxID=34508 RepID=A0A4V6A372_STECR|nr:hypothetical protein L596_015746 [Steinernema carpocapsae]